MSFAEFSLQFPSGICQVRVGQGWLANLPPTQAWTEFLSQLPRRLIIASDANTIDWASKIVDRLAESNRDCRLHLVPAGEASKSLTEAQRLWEAMLNFGLDRSAGAVAIGGGVVGDLVGFAAATFMRGIPWSVVPTSVVAQVDSSIGGKVGINLASAKNIVGAFFQPSFVAVDIDFLGSLPSREFTAGLAEVAKYAMIADTDLFQILESKAEKIRQRDPETLLPVISACCQLKGQIVTADERELTGRRAVLNYGHTFGHALESVRGLGHLSHGEAVSIGMACAAKAAVLLGRFDEASLRRQNRLLRKLQLPVTAGDADPDTLIAAMKLDKKRHGGLPRLVLPNRIGNVEIVDWPGDHLVREAILSCGHDQ